LLAVLGIRVLPLRELFELSKLPIHLFEKLLKLGPLRLQGMDRSRHTIRYAVE
jgi:hypothetical protein